MAVYDDSRYITCALVERPPYNTPMLAFRSRPTFNMDDATSYIWQSGDTLDGVAFKLYGNMNLRWAILDANPQYRTEFDINPGDTLYIPDFEEVVELVDG